MTSFSFDAIGSTRVPGSQVEISNVRALTGLPAAEQKILLVGQRLSTGSVAELTPRRISQADQGADYFGEGSQLAQMVRAAIGANSQTELWAIGIDDDAGGTAATWTITITGPATAAGTLAYSLAGERITAAVASGASATTAAAAVVAAITARPDLPVTAENLAGVITLTCRHKGTMGNDLRIMQNIYDGDVVPAGLTSVIAAGTAGAGNPDLTDVWAALGDEQYPTIGLGINDATNLTATDTEMDSRWGPQRQIEGRAYGAVSGSFSALTTLGALRNGVHTTLAGLYRSPTPPWRVASVVAAVSAYYLQIDPARPLTDLTLPGIIAPATADQFTRSERDQLLRAGISTLRVLPGGVVAIERLITCYQRNIYGFADTSYLDITTPATLGYLRASWRARMAQKFPRAKLTDDTIRSVRAETIALAQEWYNAGLIEDLDGFVSGLVIERDASNATQLNVLMTPNSVNGLLQLAARIEFIL